MDIEELWTEFHAIRDKIHKSRRVIYGVPPDHWELVEKVAIKELVANELNKLKAEHEKEINILKEFKFKYESLCK
jgi:hypothetical protein